jgi:uncharacterized protein
MLAAAVLLTAVALAALAYAALWESYRPVVRRHEVSVPFSWPHISLLHVSDLHVNRRNERLQAAQGRALRGLPAPDLLLVTGDLCESRSDVESSLELLRLVRPRLGTFMVLGNHEYAVHRPGPASGRQLPFWACVLNRITELVLRQPDSEPEQQWAIRSALTAGGIEVLVNQGRRIEAGGTSLWIAGCDSAWGGSADMQAAVRGRRPDEATLALVHEPELAFAAQAVGADLVLAGHTHGGQIRLPIVGAPYSHRIDSRLRVAAGFQLLGKTLLHISAGLGQTVPLRLGCPPEVTWLDCTPMPRPAVEVGLALNAEQPVLTTST